MFRFGIKSFQGGFVLQRCHVKRSVSAQVCTFLQFPLETYGLLRFIANIIGKTLPRMRRGPISPFWFVLSFIWTRLATSYINMTLPFECAILDSAAHVKKARVQEQNKSSKNAL